VLSRNQPRAGQTILEAALGQQRARDGQYCKQAKRKPAGNAHSDIYTPGVIVVAGQPQAESHKPEQS
jgi:hypothetical protein